MEVDVELTVHQLVPKGEFNLGFVAAEVGKVVVAHRNGAILLGNEAGILEPDLGPGVDGEPSVFIACTIFAGDEVRLGFGFRSSELLNGTLGGFEEDGSRFKGVKFVEEIARKGFAFGSGVLEGSYFDYTCSPFFLGGKDLIFRDH